MEPEEIFGSRGESHHSDEEILGGVKYRTSRQSNAVRLLGEPTLAMFESLDIQANEEDEDAESSPGEPAAAFANAPASTPGRDRTPFLEWRPLTRNDRHLSKNEGRAASIAGRTTDSEADQV